VPKCVCGRGSAPDPAKLIDPRLPIAKFKGPLRGGSRVEKGESKKEVGMGWEQEGMGWEGV